MKSRLLFVAMLFGCIALWSPLGAQDKENGNDKAKPDEKTDITAQVRELNSDKYMSPPTKCRPGHANPRQLDAKAIKQTDTGFEVKFPSGAPIPTPTIYKGKMYVSGGFHSKEYYCLDATTGKLVWGVDLDDDGP